MAGKYFLDLIHDELSKEKNYLDFDSGSGEIVASLVEQGIAVAAYEISDERAHSLNKLKNTSDSFIGYISNSDKQLFDTVLMTEVIEHILPDQLIATIEIIKSKLKPGGMLIITTPNEEDIDLGGCYCPTCNHTFHRCQHLSSFSVKSLENLMLDCGFSTKDMHLVDFSMNMKLIEENKKLMAEINSLKKSFFEKFIERMFDKTVEEDEEHANKGLRLGALSHILYIGVLQAA